MDNQKTRNSILVNSGTASMHSADFTPSIKKPEPKHTCTRLEQVNKHDMNIYGQQCYLHYESGGGVWHIKQNPGAMFLVSGIKYCPFCGSKLREWELKEKNRDEEPDVEKYRSQVIGSINGSEIMSWPPIR